MENYDLITKAIQYIDKESGKVGLTIDDVAKAAGFSSDYFNRIFRSHTGFNVMEYVRFRRLSRAAVRLRHEDDTILDIGMKSGYDSHDGFTRAFKAQYGKTPSEYRETMKNLQVKFADLGLNAAAGARIMHMLPEFSVIPSDEAIDYLLSVSARKFGYDAISIDWNGTCVLTDRSLSEHGCYIGADMFYGDGPYLYLHVRHASELRAYAERLQLLKPNVIHTCIEEETTLDTVKQALAGLGHKEVKELPQTMYFGEAAALPETKYSFRFLDTPDAAAVRAWTAKANVGWRMEKTMSIPMENRPADLPIGMFDGEQLIGISRTGIQEAHGFRLNNCIVPAILKEYASDELYRLFYKASLNLILGCSCIPFEDMLFGELSKKCGNFNAFDIGYELVNTVYMISY